MSWKRDICPCCGAKTTAILRRDELIEALKEKAQKARADARLVDAMSYEHLAELLASGEGL